MANYETSSEIELAIAHYFDYREYIIVPNVSWGIFGYELDMCLLRYMTLYAQEVEIKVTKADLKRDSKKHHHHKANGQLIRQLWFAMPEKIRGSDIDDLVPADAGIIYVDARGRVRMWREAKINKFAKKWTIADAFKLGRLGTMRIWTLKENLHQLHCQLRALQKEMETK